MEIVAAALIAAIPATIAALASWSARKASRQNQGLLTGIDASVNGRPPHEPKLYDLVANAASGLEGQIAAVHIEAAAARTEATTARGMVEELAAQYHKHTVDDREDFRVLHDAIVTGNADETLHALTASDDRAAIASDLAVQQEQE